MFRCEHDPETKEALQKQWAGIWCIKESHPITVFTGHHEYEGRCYTVEDVADYANELEMMLESGEEEGYTKEEIMPFIEKCAALKVGENATLGTWKIECTLMRKRDYESLPEWGGW